MDQGFSGVHGLSPGGTLLASQAYMNPNVLAQIRVLDTELIHSFEWRQPAERALELDLDGITTIRHPFLVTPAGPNSYLLLTEAGYFRALVEAGLNHLPVQLAPPSYLRLGTDRLGLDGFGLAEMRRLTARHSDQLLFDGPQPPPPGFLPARIRFGTKAPARSLYLRDSGRSGCPQSLDLLFRAILHTGRYISLEDYTGDQEGLMRATPVSAVLDLPAFDLEAIKTAASADRLFPPGLIRVGCSRRILDIDYPLKVLASSMSAEDKEAFFKDLLVLRRQTRRTSVHRGEVYLLNRQMFS